MSHLYGFKCLVTLCLKGFFFSPCAIIVYRSPLVFYLVHVLNLIISRNVIIFSNYALGNVDYNKNGAGWTRHDSYIVKQSSFVPIYFAHSAFILKSQILYFLIQDEIEIKI